MSGSIYVVVVRAGREHMAAADMASAGVVAYVPTERRWARRMGSRCAARDLALLPRYVFVWSNDIRRDNEAIHKARHVANIIGGEAPLALTGNWLMQTLLVQTLGGLDYTASRKPKMSVGQAVRIVAGPFQGLMATVDALIGGDNGRKLRISIQAKGCFGGPMTLARDKVERVV